MVGKRKREEPNRARFAVDRIVRDIEGLKMGEETQRGDEAVGGFEGVGDEADAAVGDVERGEGGEAREAQRGLVGKVFFVDACTAQHVADRSTAVVAHTCLQPEQNRNANV